MKIKHIFHCKNNLGPCQIGLLSPTVHLPLVYLIEVLKIRLKFLSWTMGEFDPYNMLVSNELGLLYVEPDYRNSCIPC